jgi:hypothetical protein
VRATGFSHTRLDALAVLCHLSSDLYDPNGAATRRVLDAHGALDRTVGLIYLSPRARSSGLSNSSALHDIVFFALGLLQNLCVSTPGRLASEVRYLSELAQSADGHAPPPCAWAGSAIAQRAATCLLHHASSTPATERRCTAPDARERPGRRMLAEAPAQQRRLTHADGPCGACVSGASREGGEGDEGDEVGAPALATARASAAADAAARVRPTWPARRLRAVDDGVVAILSALPTYEHTCTAPPLVCTICLEEVGTGETLRAMPCAHAFHMACSDRWLLSCAAHDRFCCPSCRHDVRPAILDEQRSLQ